MDNENLQDKLVFQISPVATQTSQPKNKRQYKTGYFLPLLGVVILLLVIAGGVYYYFSKQGVKTPVTTTIRPTTQPSSGSADTSNWKTYINTNGYTLKYPDTYEVIPQTERQISQLGKDNNTCISLIII